MGCRRKTKTERELVADIHKTFNIFCYQRACRDCPYKDYDICELEWLRDLLDKDVEE